MDAFGDLWKEAAPSTQAKPKSSQPLNALSGTTTRQNIAKPDAFAFLSAPSSIPGSRSLSPALPSKPAPPPPSTAFSPSIRGDAFSGLMSFGGSTSSFGNMSLSDAQAKREQERREKERKEKEAFEAQSSFWDRFDSAQTQQSLSSSKAASLLMPEPVRTASGSSRISTPALEPLKPSSISRPASSLASQPAPVTEDIWDLDAFASPTSAAATRTIHTPDPFDLDLSTSPIQVVPAREPTPRSVSPGDFDFGDREDAAGFLDDDNDGGENDILGVLSRPANAGPQRGPSPLAHQNGSSRPSHSPLPPRTQRSSSPPPHVVGQIVEMGFSPQQARSALAATKSGMDVQAALDNLLQSQSQLGSARHSPIPRDLAPEREPERDPEEDAAERRRRRRQGPSRQSTQPTDGAPREAASATDLPNLQEQADKLLAQASEIGLSMFTRANALWNQSKEKVQKAYEERAKVVAPPVEDKSDRPRWMADGLVDDREEHSPEWKQPSFRDENGGFRDDGQRVEEPVRRPARRKPTEESPRAESSRRQADTGSLISDEPAVYASPARRRTRPPQSNGSPSSSHTAASAPVAVAPPPPPKPKPVRPSVPASPSVLAASESHRAKGTEYFKLGRFAEADTCYTSALDVLPHGHSLRILLHNNRSAARLKTGNQAGVVDDSTAVVQLLGPGFKPAAEEEWDGVKLGDALVKALTRRAEAWEMGEKWERAEKDWESVVVLGQWIGKKRWDLAMQGVGRCRRMKDNDKAKEAAPTPASKPALPTVKPKPSVLQSSSRQPPSEALSRLRSANNAQEAEESMRASLKDSVDSRLTAWKGGKETNLRALIASLDTVLWEELGWQKVGLSDLITPGQVKARYVRAISKLHPDKLNTSNTTVEHRMIANGVFGALNEAWNAFQQ